MLVVQIQIARAIGIVGAGYVAVAFTYTGLLAVVGRQGTDQLIMRRVAAADSAEHVGREYLAALAVCSPVLWALTPLLAGGAWLLAELSVLDQGAVAPMTLMAVGIPALGVLVVQGEAIKGAGRPVAGAAVQSLIGPVASLAVLLALWGHETATNASAAIAAGYWVAAVAAHVYWRRVVTRRPSGDRSDPTAFRSEARPFFGASVFAMLVLNAPIVALSLSADPGEAATYFAADRWTQILSMMLVAVNSTVGPVFAREWARGRPDQVAHTLRRSTTATLPLALVVSGALAVAAPWLLGAFGDDFADGVPVLRTMLVGHFVVLACGPVTVMMTMIGEERFVRSVTALAATISVVGSFALVPSLGSIGAAVAAAAALATSRAMILIRSRRVLRDVD